MTPLKVSEPPATVRTVRPVPGPLMILPLKVEGLELELVNCSVALPDDPFWMVAPVAPGATASPAIHMVERPHRSSVAELPLLPKVIKALVKTPGLALFPIMVPEAMVTLVL